MSNYSDVPRPESVLYFEQSLRRHSNIVYYEKMEDFVYKLVLRNDNIYLALLTNKYTVSINDVVEKIDEGFDALVTISMWNSYTSEAKKYALENQFGLFTFREFMGALNFLDPSQYYTGIDEKDGKRLYGERGYKFD
ncbi:hypothetical protein [Streptococcus gordonii]|jgi:hypothetical protein|uniref:hypothetical protein n=1 Tax=Streptococcus gordonii TaxID=1302 RepID=UPI002284BCC4|nr:hypothetical protein [Streptococcus gordonii]MCY7132205.1 hypothetical protein [Streptococcus gordonii]